MELQRPTAVRESTARTGSQRIDELVESLAASLIDVEPERCDTVALRATAAEMLELAALLDALEDQSDCRVKLGGRTAC